MRNALNRLALAAVTTLIAACGSDDSFPYYLFDDTGNGSGDAAVDADAGTDAGTDADPQDTGGDTAPECQGDGDCGEGMCLDGRCVPDGGVCSPGDARCVGDTLEVCDDEGQSWDGTPCAAGCVDEGVAHCGDQACAPFSRGCQDRLLSWVCVADGTGTQTSACGAATRCSSGTCIDDCISTSLEVLEFGEIATGTSFTADVDVTSCAAGETIIEEVYLLDGDSFYTEFTGPLRFSSVGEVEVTFAPSGAGEHSDTLVIVTDTGAEIRLPLFGFAEGDVTCGRPRAGCFVGDGSPSTSLGVRVDETVSCEDTGSTSPTTIIAREWEIVSAPAESEIEDTTWEGTSFDFVPDVPGIYRVEYDVLNADEEWGCTRAAVTVNATEVATNELHVQLTWADDADLDLHLVRGESTFNHGTYDCHYNNMVPDWGAIGALNDPTLDFDATSGTGPENINLPVPESSMSYRAYVGIQTITGGTTTATVRVFSGGELQMTATRTVSTGDTQFPMVQVFYNASGRLADVVDLTDEEGD